MALLAIRHINGGNIDDGEWIALYGVFGGSCYYKIHVVYYIYKYKIEIVSVMDNKVMRRLCMWNVLKDIGLMSIGAFVGVVLMCLLQVNR